MAIRNVLEAVLCLMGQGDTSWNNMKKLLAGTGLKERIMSFQATSITPEMRKSASAIIAAYPDAFEPERISRVSLAAAPMAEWVQARPLCPFLLPTCLLCAIRMRRHLQVVRSHLLCALWIWVYTGLCA